jgi:hypothetical protein
MLYARRSCVALVARDTNPRITIQCTRVAGRAFSDGELLGRNRVMGGVRASHQISSYSYSAKRYSAKRYSVKR